MALFAFKLVAIRVGTGGTARMPCGGRAFVVTTGKPENKDKTLNAFLGH